MYNCNYNCRICPRIIISSGVSVVTVDGTDTLVIDLPAPAVGTVPYLNHCKYCVVVAQTVPDTATINMPVAFSIGGDTTTVYPFLNCDCTQVTACAIQTRTKYPVAIVTTATTGSFRSLRKLNCYPTAVLSTLPVPDTTAVAGTFSLRTGETVAPQTVSTTKTTTTKVVTEVK